jgi:hypothetical protein
MPCVPVQWQPTAAAVVVHIVNFYNAVICILTDIRY